MRYLPLHDVVACATPQWQASSPGWRVRVEMAANKSAEIGAIGNKWSELKPAFVDRFGDKCWYTESPRIGTDNNVDHFRPKSSAKKRNGKTALRSVAGHEELHIGYWWLAYEISNYRYSCVYANRITGQGGKGEYFPLENENTRAWVQADNMDIEEPSLLDPCSETDVQLIEFDHVPGDAVARYDVRTDPFAFGRFQCSSKHYNLNEASIVKARLGVLNNVKKDLDLLENCWKLLPAQRAVLAGSIASAENSIISACDRAAVFSAAVVSLVKTRRADPWMANVIPRADLSP